MRISRALLLLTTTFCLGNVSESNGQCLLKHRRQVMHSTVRMAPPLSCHQQIIGQSAPGNSCPAPVATQYSSPVPVPTVVNNFVSSSVCSPCFDCEPCCGCGCDFACGGGASCGLGSQPVPVSQPAPIAVSQPVPTVVVASDPSTQALLEGLERKLRDIEGKLYRIQKTDNLNTPALEDIRDELKDSNPNVPSLDGLEGSSTFKSNVPNQTEYRVWRDNTLKHSVRARIDNMDEHQITLLKENGRECTLKLARLSGADLNFIASVKLIEATSSAGKEIASIRAGQL